MQIHAALIATLVLGQVQGVPADTLLRTTDLVDEFGGSAMQTVAAAPIGDPSVSTKLAPAENELVAWATDRFALVGLDLPDVDVTFHDHTEPCKWNQGIYRGGRGVHRVEICVPDHGTFASDLHRRRTLIHELAHAWEHANLDESGRERLLTVLDAEAWFTADLVWEDRGGERFAETIVWGLYDQLRRPTLIDAPCAEIHADFQFITGHSALGPIEPLCDVEPGRDARS